MEISKKKAKKDIVCYKMVQLSPKEDENTLTYYTPFKSTEITVPGTLIAKGRRFRSFKEAKDVGAGYIHAYTTLDKAVNYTILLGGRIIRSVIPKGTKYHLSENGTEICARKMKFEVVYY